MTIGSYEELAGAAERGELRRKPGTRRVGGVAAQIARDALMEATGAGSPEEAASLTLGRPRVGHGRGPHDQQEEPPSGLGILVAMTEDLGLYDEHMPMPPGTRAE